MIDNVLFDFIKMNFPEEAKELKMDCINIHSTIDGIIDKLVDNISIALKEERNFELANQYTQKAEGLYKLNNVIEDALKNIIDEFQSESLHTEPKIEPLEFNINNNIDDIGNSVDFGEDKEGYDTYYDALKFK